MTNLYYNVPARRQGAPLTLTSGILIASSMKMNLSLILDAPLSCRYNLPA
jgi:hypothetical protein